MLTDRIGTGLLVASVVGVVVAGLAARPLVVSETEETERNANAFRVFILDRGDQELIRNLETANTIELGDGLFRTCVARDDRRRYFCTLIDVNEQSAGHGRGSERRAELHLPALKRHERAAGAHLEHLEPVATGMQRGLRDHHREVLAALPPQVEAAPDGADAPIHRHREVAVLAERHAAQGPVTRVGKTGSPGVT